MAWYSNGTIQVAANGTTATGTNTQFLGNVRIGDGISIEGSGALHEVTGITSNTQLSFQPPYAGAAGSGKTFRVAPVLGYDKDLSDAFNQLRLQFGTQLSNLQEWATAPTLNEAHDKLGFSSSGKTVATGTPAQARNVLDTPRTSDLTSKSPSILVVDQLRKSVESASGGRQTVHYTAKGQPSFMYVMAAFNNEDIHAELGTGLHPAFLSNGVKKERFVGVYQGSWSDSEVVSQPGKDPMTSINYDTAVTRCQNSGPGFDASSNWDWAAITLWCMANGFEPRGNTYYGLHHTNRWETGKRQDNGLPGDPTGTARILTGSGPASWHHDGTPAGIADMVGNVNEWVRGMKIIDGRVWLAPDNGLLDELDFIDTGFDVTNANPWSNHSSVGASELVKQALIAPIAGMAPVGRIYVNAEGERLPYRGGTWYNTSTAGLGCVYLNNARSRTGTTLGVRPAFAI